MKVRENQLRRIAERRGFRLEKSGRRDPLAVDYGYYRLMTPAGHAIYFTDPPDSPYTTTIDDLEAFLMSKDLLDLQSRNARLRAEIERLLESASHEDKDEVRHIALQLSPAPADSIKGSLELVHDNLRRRLDVLTRAGLAKYEDVRPLLYPPG